MAPAAAIAPMSVVQPAVLDVSAAILVQEDEEEGTAPKGKAAVQKVGSAACASYSTSRRHAGGSPFNPGTPAKVSAALHLYLRQLPGIAAPPKPCLT